MKKRRFGRSNHNSTLAIFGGAAFWEINQDKSDQVMDMVLDAGINHIDVAPQYGQAEVRLGPWLENKRDKFFLGCKTLERTREASWVELKRSLELLHTGYLDLYQAHAVNSFEELDQVTSKGGSLETFIQARDEKLTSYIGLTSHGLLSPAILLEALQRFDFDSILFPVNSILFADPQYREKTNELLDVCEAKDVGVMAIKSVAKEPWKEGEEKTFTTWYKPFSSQDEIQKSVNFTLSQKITGICTAGDTTLLPMIIKACENFTPMTEEEQEERIRETSLLANIFVK